MKKLVLSLLLALGMVQVALAHEAYDSRAGELYILSVNRGDHFEEILTSSTFGACQLYLDTAIRKMDRVDVDYYIDLEYVN